MSSILQDLEAKIQGIQSSSTTKTNVGTVREIGDGVAKIEGLNGAMLNEMLEFPGGLYGLALNLEETEVGAIILGDYTGVSEGDEVRTTGRLLQVPVGKALLGRVVNALGQPIDGKGPINATEFYPVEKIAPGIIARKSVSQPVQTGIMAIDAMVPVGRGQRELIIGDRATGKTTIAVDAILNQAKINKAAEAAGDPNFRPLYSIYVGIGQKSSNIARSSVFSRNTTPSSIRSSLPQQPPMPPPTSTSLRSQVRPWVSGSWTTVRTRSSCSTISPSTPLPIARCRSSSSAHRAVRLILVMFSISTAASSSVPHVSARNTATVP